MSLTFAPPDKIDLDYAHIRMVSDGRTMTTIIPPARQAFTEPAPVVLRMGTFLANLKTQDWLFGGPDGRPLYYLLRLLTGADSARGLLAGTGGARAEPDRAGEDGAAWASVRIVELEGPDVRLLIDPASHLVRRIELIYDLSEENAKLPPELRLAERSYAWTSGPIRTTRPPDSAFDVTAPSWYLPPAWAEKPDRATTHSRAELESFLGRPAPAFVVAVLGPEGGLRPIRKADLIGTVAVLFFWRSRPEAKARDLPRLRTFAEALAQVRPDPTAPGADPGVVVLAVNQDTGFFRDPEDVAEGLRVLLAGTGLEPSRAPAGTRLAVDPENGAGDAFHVMVYPTVVVLDPRGVVQAALVAPEEREWRDLSWQVRALLEGRSLVPSRTRPDPLP